MKGFFFAGSRGVAKWFKIAPLCIDTQSHICYKEGMLYYTKGRPDYLNGVPDYIKGMPDYLKGMVDYLDC